MQDNGASNISHLTASVISRQLHGNSKLIKVCVPAVPATILMSGLNVYLLRQQRTSSWTRLAINVNITDFDTPLWFYLPAAPDGVSGSILVDGHGVDWWP